MRTDREIFGAQRILFPVVLQHRDCGNLGTENEATAHVRCRSNATGRLIISVTEYQKKYESNIKDVHSEEQPLLGCLTNLAVPADVCHFVSESSPNYCLPF